MGIFVFLKIPSEMFVINTLKYEQTSTFCQNYVYMYSCGHVTIDIWGAAEYEITLDCT